MSESDTIQRLLAGDRAEEDEVGRCASRPAAHAGRGFHVRHATVISKREPARKTFRTFSYGDLGYREFDPSNTWFVFEVNEPEKWRVRVEGRGLWVIYKHLTQHRLEWIEPVLGNAALAVPDGIPVIERITIERVEDEERKR